LVTYILNTVFFLLVFVESLKQKKFQYSVAAVLTLLYFVFDVLQQDYDLIDSSQLFGWIQKITLLVLAGYQIAFLVKSTDRKKDFPVTAFAVAACVSRFCRTLLFNYYNAAMQAAGADAYALFQNLRAGYTIVDSVTRLMLLLMFFCMAMQLGKPKATNG